VPDPNLWSDTLVQTKVWPSVRSLRLFSEQPVKQK
jgi:hypothetical protein